MRSDMAVIQSRRQNTACNASGVLARWQFHGYQKPKESFNLAGLGVSGTYPVKGVWTIHTNEVDAADCVPQHAAQLVLVRGLPGSGKSTLAKELPATRYTHIEADDFFYKRGRYVFDEKLVSHAHAWCLDLTERSLKSGGAVVVSNTFVRLSEMEPYFQLVTEVLIIEMNGIWKSLHNVPIHVIEKMRTTWESIE